VLQLSEPLQQMQVLCNFVFLCDKTHCRVNTVDGDRLQLCSIGVAEGGKAMGPQESKIGGWQSTEKQSNRIYV